MPADRNPLASDQNGDDVVELQSDDRRTPGGCAPDDPRAVVTPREVSGPSLEAWVEQCNASAGPRVSRAGLSRLVVVAQATGEPEILLTIGPTCGFRDEVLNLEWPQDVLLRTQTIPAAIAGSGANPRAKNP